MPIIVFPPYSFIRKTFILLLKKFQIYLLYAFLLIVFVSPIERTSSHPFITLVMLSHYPSMCSFLLTFCFSLKRNFILLLVIGFFPISSICDFYFNNLRQLCYLNFMFSFLLIFELFLLNIKSFLLFFSPEVLKFVLILLLIKCYLFTKKITFFLFSCISSVLLLGSKELHYVYLSSNYIIFSLFIYL